MRKIFASTPVKMSTQIIQYLRVDVTLRMSSTLGAIFKYDYYYYYYIFFLFNIVAYKSFFAGKDFICVQSVDGMLSFFEQESFAFGRFIPNFLLPGPMTYVMATDSFILCNISGQIESYK